VKELGLADEIPVAGLAKRFEEIFVPGQSQPVELRRGSDALFMLQRIRDEAHRFANTFHRERRSKAMTVSALDDIAGMGDVRKKKLLKEMGGITKVKQASLEELQAHSFLPDAVALAIHTKFHS
jgi:excinuclease ABC subunit C